MGRPRVALYSSRSACFALVVMDGFTGLRARAFAIAAMAAGCHTGAGDAAAADPWGGDHGLVADVDADPGAADGDGASLIDLDLDGLDDRWELTMAGRYLPFLSRNPTEACGVSGLLARVRPHPSNPAYLHILYDQLYDEDCGLRGHVGDDESFGITVDPSLPAPQGIVAMVAVAHNDDLACQRTSNCGLCASMSPCATQTWQGASWPVVFISRNKHASYVQPGLCGLGSCLDACALATTPTSPPIVNAGEPDAHLIEDLTTQGFITAANGWTEPTLMSFDPWAAGVRFGGSGVIADNLVDPAFLSPICP
jgi:hypothetical protein